MAYALTLAQRMGRTLAELGASMSAEEFGLHLQLEVEVQRSHRPAREVDAEMQTLFGG